MRDDMEHMVKIYGPDFDLRHIRIRTNAERRDDIKYIWLMTTGDEVIQKPAIYINSMNEVHHVSR